MKISSNHRVAKRLISACALGLYLSTPAAAAGAAQVVVFPHGASTKTVHGTVKGDQSRDYLVRGSEGQTLSVSMTTSNQSAYFNVLPPGSNDEAIFIGSTSGDSFRGTLSQSGGYTVRVYLMRNAARQNQSAAYTLKLGLAGGNASAASGNHGGGGKAQISDLAGMDSIRAIDVMAERGFKDADSFNSGNTQYGIFWRPSSHQCVQLTLADGKVVSADDIGTHPKCK